MNRTNPKVQTLRFQGGFWHLSEAPNPVFHVTPHLSNILNSGGISTRYARSSHQESLGGRHTRITTMTPLIFINSDELKCLVYGSNLLREAAKSQKSVPVLILTPRS